MKGKVFESGTLNYILKHNHNLKAFLKAFYLRVSDANRFEDQVIGVAGEPVFAAPREDRRLDTFARLLELDNHDCAAVCVSGNKIMVATNGELALGVHADSKSFAESSYWKLFSKILAIRLHFRSMQEEMKDLGVIGAKSYYNPLIAYTRKVAMGAVVPFVKGDENSHLMGAMWDVLDDFALYERGQTLFAPERIDRWFELYKKSEERSGNILSDKQLYIIHRTLRDLLKLEKYLIDLEDEHPLKKYFLTDSKDIRLALIDGEVGMHAEMKLLMHAIRDGLKIGYIGISKLCCPYCITAAKHAGVELEYGDTEEMEPGTFSVRGHHGKGGPWVLSSEMLKNDAFMRSLLGDALYDQYLGFAGSIVHGKSGEVFDLQEIIRDSIPFIHQKQFVTLLEIPSERKIKTLSSLYVPASVSGEGVDESVRGVFYPDYGIVVLEGGSYFGKKIDSKELHKLLSGKSKGKVVRIHTDPSARLEDFDDEMQTSDGVEETKTHRSYVEDLTGGKITASGTYSDEVVVNLLKAYLHDDARFKIVPLREDIEPQDLKSEIEGVLEQLVRGIRVVTPIRLGNGNLAAGIWTLESDETHERLLMLNFFDLNGYDVEGLGFCDQLISIDIPGYNICVTNTPIGYNRQDEMSARTIDVLVKFAKYVDSFNALTTEQVMAKVAPAGYVNKSDLGLRTEHAKIIFNIDHDVRHEFEIDRGVRFEVIKKFGRNNVNKIIRFLHKKHNIVDVNDFNHYLKMLLSGQAEYSDFLSELPPPTFNDWMFIPGVKYDPAAPHYSGLNRVEIDGDGHCFYAAVIEGMRALGREYTIVQLRDEIYREFTEGENFDENRMLLETQIVDIIAGGNFAGIDQQFRITLQALRKSCDLMVTDHIPQEDIDEFMLNRIRELNLVNYYIEMTREYPVWAGDVEIGILARFLGVTFQIFRENGRIDLINETGGHANPLINLEYTGNHYNLLFGHGQYDAGALDGTPAPVEADVVTDQEQEEAAASTMTPSPSPVVALPNHTEVDLIHITDLIGAINIGSFM